jgi:hypothetical protein
MQKTLERRKANSCAISHVRSRARSAKLLA